MGSRVGKKTLSSKYQDSVPYSLISSSDHRGANKEAASTVFVSHCYKPSSLSDFQRFLKGQCLSPTFIFLFSSPPFHGCQTLKPITVKSYCIHKKTQKVIIHIMRRAQAQKRHEKTLNLQYELILGTETVCNNKNDNKNIRPNK